MKIDRALDAYKVMAVCAVQESGDLSSAMNAAVKAVEEFDKLSLDSQTDALKSAILEIVRDLSSAKKTNKIALDTMFPSS